MERDDYFDFDSVPSDIWRLIFKQLRALTDLRSFNSINKSCHNYSKYYMQKQKLWLGLFKKRFGLDGTKYVPSILPSKLFQPEHMLRPTLKTPSNSINLDKPLKIIVIGDGGSGKTTYLHLVACGQSQRTYLPTLGADLRYFAVTSRNKNYDLVMWDMAGGEIAGLVLAGFFRDAAGAIVMSYITGPTQQNDARYTGVNSITHIADWMRDIRRICGDIPVAVCLNKVDQAMDAPQSEIVGRFYAAAKTATDNRSMFCEMSNWAKYNVHEPLIWIMQQLTGDETLELNFPALKEDYNWYQSVVNPEMLSASAIAQREIALIKSHTANDMISSCSPRLKSVMESLLTGVRTGPASKNPLQRPSLLFVEGLSFSEFHSIHNFSFVQHLLSFYHQHTDAITTEAKSLMAERGLDDMTSVNGLCKSIYIVEAGKFNRNIDNKAPLLTQMVRGVSSSLMTCSFGYAYISILGPHSHITPHCGPCNIKLRCHLPLIVPSEGCTLRVGSTIKRFKQGELLIFDDSIEHEVHNNDSSSSRVILLFDIWHPDLTPEEINSFNTYFN